MRLPTSKSCRHTLPRSCLIFLAPATVPPACISLIGRYQCAKTPPRFPSQDDDQTLFDKKPAPTPESLANDIRDQKLMGTDLEPKLQPRSSTDLPSRPPKRPKEDDMSASAKDVKRRRSPDFERPARGATQTDLPASTDSKSAIATPPPPEPPPPDGTASDEATDADFNFIHSAQEELDEHPPLKLLRDLQTRAITVPQLIQEVKGIYAGLAMVEKKCIEIVDAQLKSSNKLTKEQWQALIALHRTLLNEHHDFFSASHHPVTKGHELRELANRHAMPARMWRHGIHAFLELLRHKLPDSIEHMISFLYLSYSMVALLKDTVPEFLETWIECLGDLARYRMAIEEVDLRDRDIWSVTAKTWYNQAADLSPNTGRIQHHLAVLARPHIVQQLFLYSKALVAAIPFRNAADSILLLLNPLLDPSSRATTRHSPAELNFVCAAAVLFKRHNIEEFFVFQAQFASSFSSHIGNVGAKFKVQGPEFAGSLFAMLMDLGREENSFWRMLFDHQAKMKQIYCERNAVEPDKLPKDFAVKDRSILEPPRREYWALTGIPVQRMATPSSVDGQTGYSSDEVTTYVGPLLLQTITDVAGHIGNKNVVPFMHMVLAYLYGLTWIPGASVYIESVVPWESIAQFLNTVGTSGVSYEIVESPGFPKSYGGSKRQLPEDFVMRGLLVMTYYYPSDFFDKDNLVDEDERLLEVPSHQAPRVERCLWAAHKLATLNDRWLSYNTETKKFATTEFAKALRS